MFDMFLEVRLEKSGPLAVSDRFTHPVMLAT